jgi:hypothetical protein
LWDVLNRVESNRALRVQRNMRKPPAL